jgi:hypothetical protein
MPIIAVAEIQADRGLVAPLPQVIMPHQPIEIDRARNTDVAGEVRHLGNSAQDRLQIANDGIRPLHGRRLVQVDDQQQLVLVIERKHFQRHHAEDAESSGRQGQQRGGQEHAYRAQARFEQRDHQRPKDALQK